MGALNGDNPVLEVVTDHEIILAGREQYRRKHGKDLPIPKGQEEFYKEHNIT